MNNIILRPVFNRPEMLYLSFEYEMRAREYHSLPGNFITLFLIEAGTPQEVLNVLQKYPYESVYEFRPQRYGLTVNILEGMKRAFSMADDFIVYIEDDVLLHQSYFKFMDILLNKPEIQGKYSILSPFSKVDEGNVSHVVKLHHYAALAPLIPKEFHSKYILPHSVKEYYQNEPSFTNAMDKHYAEHHGKGYKYSADEHKHWQQAGMINRLVDIASINEDKWVINPRINRQQHIGYVGVNRPGGVIRGNGFEERVASLRETIKTPEALYEATGSKQYNDYTAFRPELKEWDGTLELIDG